MYYYYKEIKTPRQEGFYFLGRNAKRAILRAKEISIMTGNRIKIYRDKDIVDVPNKYYGIIDIPLWLKPHYLDLSDAKFRRAF